MGSKGFQSFKTPRRTAEGTTPVRRTENSIESVREKDNTELLMRLNTPNPAKI